MVAARRFELSQLLERFVPDPSEERVLAEMMLLVRDPGDPFSRYVYEPGHFTADMDTLFVTYIGDVLARIIDRL